VIKEGFDCIIRVGRLDDSDPDANALGATRPMLMFCMFTYWRSTLKNVTPVLLALLATSAQAAEAPTFDPQRLSRDVKVLSSDEFEGRGPNTAGETKTVDYLIEQFKAAGLKPGGDLSGGKRSWTQDVPLGRFEITGPVKLTLTDGKGSRNWPRATTWRCAHR
jgi:hypothetical protein